MINIEKVAHQIKFDGMYNTVLNEMEENEAKDNLSVEEIEEVLGRSKRALLLLKSLSLVEDKSKHTLRSEEVIEQTL